MFFNEETENEIDGLAEEFLEAVRDERLVFYEGCTIVTAPTGAPPEYITVMVDGVNDPNVYWRGVPPTPAVGQEVLVWHNPISDRREIVSGSGATGTSGGSYCQKVTVAACNGDFTTLGAAVAWINALPAAQVPSATRLYAINVLGGTFVEAANVTVPQYVDVSGEGESSVIDMGANSLLMSDDSSLLDLKVKSSNASYAVAVVGKDSVVLRNVHSVETGGAGTPDCFHVSAGSTDVRLHDCVAEIPANGVGFHVLGSSEATLHTCTTLASAYDATTYGFQVGDTATAILDYCTADDDTYFNDALHLDNTALTCTARWCTFRGHDNDVNVAGASATWHHLDCHFDPDNSTVAAGTHTALPTKRFNQCLVVAEEGGDFQALSEAVAWINAQGDAASDKLYGVMVLHGNFAEAANVTIPQYVHVFGMGRGTEIEMGNKVLLLSDDSSLKDVTVETVMDATTVYCIRCQSVANFELRNVLLRFTPHSSGANVGFYFLGTASGAAYHCIADPQAGSATGTVIGFSVEDTANVLLWDCEADDTDLDDALWIGDVADTPEATTKYCSFHADGNDVNFVATSGTWTYHQDDFDPDNCTVSGIADPADGQEAVYFACTKTAGAAADFATVQAAIDWFANRLLCAACKIDIVTGATYAEELVIEDVFCTAEGRLELEGDIRGMAGATWVDDAVITCQDANAGSGTCGLSNAGAVITVTGTGGNPDFDADGWGNGDTCIIRNNAGAETTYNINATLNNTITLTVAAPAVGNTGTSITLVPNTVVAPAGAGDAITVEAQGILLDGLYLNASAGATGNGLLVNPGAECQCQNVLAVADDMAFYAVRGGYVEANDGSCTAVSSTVGFYATQGGVILADRAVAVGCSTYGFAGDRTGFCHASYAVATDCVIGFAGAWLGGIRCQNSYALQNATYGFWATRQGFNDCWTSRTLATNGTDYRADYNSYMYAVATNVGGPTYSPAVSDTEGNVFGIITFS